MANSIARLEEAAANLSKVATRLTEHDDERKLALGAVFVAALLSWFALALGEPVLLLTLPATGYVFWKMLGWMRARSAEAYEAADEPVEIDHSRLFSAVRIAQAAYDEPTSTEREPTSPEQFPSFGPLPTLAVIRKEAEEAEAKAEAEDEGERYEVRDKFSPSTPLLVAPRFDEAADFALDFLAAHEERTLEIVHVKSGERETVSTYARGLEDEPEGPGSLIDLYGFPVGWRAAPPTFVRRD